MTFKDLTRSIFPYFQLKLPSPETHEAWTEDAGKYPAEFYDWACQRLKAGKKASLENLPQTIFQLWQEWLRANPRKNLAPEHVCHEACHRGWIGYFVKDGPRGTYRAVRARCGHCKRIQSGEALMLTVRQIEANGWLVATDANCRKVSAHDREIGLGAAVKYQGASGGRLSAPNQVDATLSALELEKRLFQPKEQRSLFDDRDCRTEDVGAQA